MKHITATIVETSKVEITFEAADELTLAELEDMVKQELTNVNTHKNELEVKEIIEKIEILS